MTTTRRPADFDDDERAALAGLDAQLDAIRGRHQGDPPLDLLRAAHHDVLPGELQDQVSGHLRDNAWSRALVEGLDAGDGPELGARDADRLLRRIERAAQPAAGPAAWFRYVLVASGLVTAALALMLRPGLAPPAPSAVTAPPPAAAAPDVTAAHAPATSPGELPGAIVVPFEPAAVALSMASLTWRGGAAGPSRLAAFKPAFDAYRAGDYARAAAAFAALAAAHPGAVEPPFYQGVSLLLTGDFAAAVTALSAPALASDETFAAPAAWYRAVAELRLGRVREARPRLRALCASGSQPQACAALSALPPA
jgi:hypothetical protein